MNNILRVVFILLGVVGVTKGHLIKVIILAALGLAGLWMIHTLAQDYTRIQYNNNKVRKSFAKRSTSMAAQIDWELVLSRDPASCARSFICQLGAQDATELDATEKNLLKLTKDSATDGRHSWASSQLLEALAYGEDKGHPSKCQNLYKLCPFSSKTMTSLLRILGR